MAALAALVAAEEGPPEGERGGSTSAPPLGIVLRPLDASFDVDWSCGCGSGGGGGWCCMSGESTSSSSVSSTKDGLPGGTTAAW